ncbi:MAG: type II and III secretion system protein, partial [bacterium]|nr:type II and III secretion system protein [bacterium]
TAGYFGATEGQGQVFTPPPTISFEDLGVVVKVTPHVHGDEDVTLEVEAEFKVLAGTALNGIPVIANRSFQGVIRLRNDEWAIMAGLVEAQEVRAISGLIGLSQIPILGPLFRRTTTDRNGNEALLVIKPTLVNLPPMELASPEIWTGTESRPKTSI